MDNRLSFALIPTAFVFFTYTYILFLKKQMTHIFLRLVAGHRPAQPYPALLFRVSEAALRLRENQWLSEAQPTFINKIDPHL